MAGSDRRFPQRDKQAESPWDWAGRQMAPSLKSWLRPMVGGSLPSEPIPGMVHPPQGAAQPKSAPTGRAVNPVPLPTPASPQPGINATPQPAMTSNMALKEASIGEMLALAALSGVPISAIGGAAMSPKGHRLQGAYRGVSHYGGTLQGAGVGGVLGALAGSALGGDSGAIAGAIPGAAIGGLAGHRAWDWTVPQPTWERKSRESKLNDVDEIEKEANALTRLMGRKQGGASKGASVNFDNQIATGAYSPPPAVTTEVMSPFASRIAPTVKTPSILDSVGSHLGRNLPYYAAGGLGLAGLYHYLNQPQRDEEEEEQASQELPRSIGSIEDKQASLGTWMRGLGTNAKSYSAANLTRRNLASTGMRIGVGATATGLADRYFQRQPQQTTMDQVKGYGQQAIDFTKAHPWEVGLGAAGIGAAGLLGASLLGGRKRRRSDDDEKYASDQIIRDEFAFQRGFLVRCAEQGLDRDQSRELAKRASDLMPQYAEGFDRFFQ